MQHQQKLLLSFMLFYRITAAIALTSQEIAQIALDSTVLLVINNTWGRSSLGSGFVVRDGQIATNYHVIEGIRNGYAKMVGGTTEYAVEAILGVDEARDLAIVKIPGVGAPALPLGDSDAVQIGDIVYVAGNPRGLEGTFSEGIISAIRPGGNNLVDGKVLQMTAPISPGSSGGPVLNNSGEVIGISVGQYEGGQNLNIAIPVNYLKALLTTRVDNFLITEVYNLYSGSLSVAFSPDGQYIATGDSDGDVGLWEVSSGNNLYYKNLGGQVKGVAFSPDGRQLAADGANGGVRAVLLDVSSGAEVQHRDIHDEATRINSVAFSPDGQYVATGVDLHWAFLWEVMSGRQMGWGRTDASEVYAVAFSLDGKYLATGNDAGEASLWELRNWWTDDVDAQHIELGGNVRALAFSPDGKYLAADGYDGSNTNVTIYNMNSSRTVWQIDPDIYEVYALAFSPDGEYLAVGGDDEKITFYRVGTDITKVKAILASGQVNDLAWSPDGNLISDGRKVYRILIQSEVHDEPPAQAAVNTTVSISPSPVSSPSIGARLTLSLNITDGENVAGYQATVGFDTSAFRYVASANGDYLPADAFFVTPVVSGNKVALAATSLSEESNGDGTLATVTFEVLTVKTSTLILSDVLLSDSAGAGFRPQIENGEVVETPQVTGDVNGDGIANIQDLVLVAGRLGQTGQSDADINGDGVVNLFDLITVASALGNAAAAPSLTSQTPAILTAAKVEDWLTQVQRMALTDPVYLRGIAVLEQLLAALTPKEMTLLPNYPNPFNPETWIPYHLAHAADVQVTIYDTKGVMVRRLVLGHQSAGYYTVQSKAAYWDGRNEFGERVASGVYFYQLQAGEDTAVRRMVILK